MKKFKSILKALLLSAVFVAALLLALPEINFKVGDNQIRINIVDDYFKPLGYTFTDFKKGEGLYPTKLVVVDFAEGTSLEAVQNTLNTVKFRRDTAQLGDIEIGLIENNGIYSLAFNYPDYYIEAVEYTNWLIAKGDVSFTTSGETPQLLDLNDYDIQGEIQIEYSSTYGEHLSFYFNESKSALVASELQSSNQFFVLNIDNTYNFYIVDFDRYIDTNVNRVRAVSTFSFLGADDRTVSNFISVARSYFLTPELGVELTVRENVSSLPAENKPASLSIIAIFLALFSVLPIALITFLQTRNIKTVLRNVIWSALTALLFVALLKFVGAVLSLNLVLGYLLGISLSQLVIFYWEALTAPKKTIVILILFFGLVSKFFFLSYFIGVVGGTVVLSFVALYIASFYKSYIQNFNLNLPRIKKQR